MGNSGRPICLTWIMPVGSFSSSQSTPSMETTMGIVMNPQHIVSQNGCTIDAGTGSISALPTVACRQQSPGSKAMTMTAIQREIVIQAPHHQLPGFLSLPVNALGVVLFAHGSGS